MKRFFVIMVLLLSPRAFASIAYVNGTTQITGCTEAGGVPGSGTCSPTYTPTSGNEIVMFLRGGSATPLSSYAQDSLLNTLSQGQSSVYSSASSLQSFLGVAGSSGLSYTVTGMQTADSLAVLEYSGVLSVNLNPTVTCPGGTLSGNRCTGTGTAISVGVTLDDANDFAVCSLSQVPPNAGGTFSSPVGNSRQTPTNPTQIVLDNTSATAGATVTMGATLSASTAWNSACIELRTVTGTIPAYTIGQITPSAYVALAGPAGCPATGGVVTCSWSLKTTTLGSSYVIHMSDHSDFNDAQRTLVRGYICRSNNPCLSSSGDLVDTVVLPGAACQSYVQDAQPESDSNDNGYVISGGGGGTVATVTLSGADSVNTERKILTLVEFIPSSGFTFAFDGCGTSTFTALASSFAGTALAGLTGTNDAVVQGWTGGAYAQSMATPYGPPTGQGESVPNHMGIWAGTGLIPSGGSIAAATITALNGTNGGSGTALALKYQANSSSKSGGRAIIF